MMAPLRVNAEGKQKSLSKHKTLEQHFQQMEGHRTTSQAKARLDASMNKQDARKENTAMTGGITLSSSKAIGGKVANHNKTPMTLPTWATTEKARNPLYNIMLSAGAINIGGEEETNDMELDEGTPALSMGLASMRSSWKEDHMANHLHWKDCNLWLQVTSQRSRMDRDHSWDP
jgi:hypothetical protein